MLEITQKFKRIMDSLYREGFPTRIAVAVSGGADSLCLAHLLKGWCDVRGMELLAVTVDHQLRAESADEALQVKDQMRRWHIPHTILQWDHAGVIPISNVHKQAREARYSLMAAWCDAQAIEVLATGHHADDQIETFWLRLMKGSGPLGLACMPLQTQREGLTLIRPLLNIPKADILKFMQSQGFEWVEDPSNQSSKYARGKLRNIKAWQEKAGIADDMLLKSIARFTKLREEIKQMVQKALIDLGIGGDLELPLILEKQRFSSFPLLTQCYVLVDLIARIGSKPYFASSHTHEMAIQRILDYVASEKACTTTLGGCVIKLKKKHIVIAKESSRHRMRDTAITKL